MEGILEEDDGDEPLTEFDLRCLVRGAAVVLEEYANSPVFNFMADKEILREIMPGIEKIQDILDRGRKPQ